eukprot:scaffold505_cov133-Isochrysis_galbana.AAC.1
MVCRAGLASRAPLLAVRLAGLFSLACIHSAVCGFIGSCEQCRLSRQLVTMFLSRPPSFPPTSSSLSSRAE